MSILDTLVTNRTAGSYYNAEDLNRLSKAIYYVAEFLSQNGYPTPLAEGILPYDRTENDYFYVEDGELLLATLEQLRINFGSIQPSSIPTTFQYLDYTGANALEKFLLDIYRLLLGSIAQFLECGTFECE